MKQLDIFWSVHNIQITKEPSEYEKKKTEIALWLKRITSFLSIWDNPVLINKNSKTAVIITSFNNSIWGFWEFNWYEYDSKNEVNLSAENLYSTIKLYSIFKNIESVPNWEILEYVSSIN